MTENERNTYEAYQRSYAEALQKVVGKLINGELVELHWCDSGAGTQL